MRCKVGGAQQAPLGKTCASATRSGHLEVIKWLRANGCDWDSLTCTNAAVRGHLEVLKWARANGCDWNSSTCAVAAGGGHLEVLMWARANGCHWNSGTCALAVRGGHLEVLKWARANRTAATGTAKRVPMRKILATWKCSSGQGPTAARTAMFHFRIDVE